MSLIFDPQNTEIRQLLDTDARPVWQRAVLNTVAKAGRVLVTPTRKTGGAFTSQKVLPKVDIYGRPIVNKPGIYPYGSATGTTPVTSTSLKAGTYKRAKIKGKGVTKRKAEKIWGRYVPCDGITNAANTSIDTGVKAQDNIEMLIRVKATTGSFYILQSRENIGATIYGVSGSSANNTIVFAGITSDITRTEDHIYTIKGTVINSVGTLYVKDETTGLEATKTATVSRTYPSPTTIKLFGDASKIASGATVYRAYIKVNGQMAWDMYPAVDVNNSNAPVAYDDVTHAASTVKSGSITRGGLLVPITGTSSTPAPTENDILVSWEE